MHPKAPGLPVAIVEPTRALVLHAGTWSPTENMIPLLYNPYFKAFGLKGNGTVFVREPVKKSYGMPAGEIRTLFANAGLWEADGKESKSEYMGRFKSASASI